MALWFTFSCGSDDNGPPSNSPIVSGSPGTAPPTTTREDPTATSDASGPNKLVVARTAGHSDAAIPYDRFTWEFSGALPSAPVITPLDTPPHGEAGSSWLLVRFGNDVTGGNACDGPTPVTDSGDRVAIVSWSCAQFTLAMEWVVGLTLEAAPAVVARSLDSPARWYIDVEYTPSAPQIDPEPNVVVLGEFTEEIALDVRRSAAAQYTFDSDSKARAFGVTPPACAGFVFQLSWQVVQPYPPPDGVAVQVYATRMGASTHEEQGARGSLTAGCAEISVTNITDGSAYASPVTVHLRYVFASRES